MRFIFRRLAFYLLALFISLSINFFLPHLMPGDPATIMFGRFQGRLPAETLEAMKIAFGFVEGSLWDQYIAYLQHAIRFDFGISIYRFPAPVNTVISTGLAWTVLLGSVALAFAFVIGTFLGILASWRRGSMVDSITTPVLMFINSFPYFWLSMLLLLVFSIILEWFPLGHAYNVEILPGWNLTFVGSVMKHLLLPAFTIVFISVGGWMLSMRNTMITTLEEDYVTMAEAKGLPQNRIMLRYAARNAMLPNFTSFGIALGFVISGSLLTEVVFTYPGLGYLLFQAVSSQDYPLLQGLFLMITIAVLTANLIVDLLYVRLDPRVRVS
jgi:peptide/nickel transport system permease protein